MYVGWAHAHKCTAQCLPLLPADWPFEKRIPCAVKSIYTDKMDYRVLLFNRVFHVEACTRQKATYNVANNATMQRLQRPPNKLSTWKRTSAAKYSKMREKMHLISRKMYSKMKFARWRVAGLCPSVISICRVGAHFFSHFYFFREFTWRRRNDKNGSMCANRFRFAFVFISLLSRVQCAMYTHHRIASSANEMPANQQKNNEKKKQFWNRTCGIIIVKYIFSFCHTFLHRHTHAIKQHIRRNFQFQWKRRQRKGAHTHTHARHSQVIRAFAFICCLMRIRGEATTTNPKYEKENTKNNVLIETDCHLFCVYDSTLIGSRSTNPQTSSNGRRRRRRRTQCERIARTFLMFVFGTTVGDMMPMKSEGRKRINEHASSAVPNANHIRDHIQT